MPNLDIHLPPLLALHGSASSGRQWRQLAYAIHGVRRLIAPDLPGYGACTDEAGTQDRLRLVSDLVENIGEPMDVVAHSFGSAVAMMIANSHPEHVRSVTLFDPVVPMQNSLDGSNLPPDLAQLWRSIAKHKGADVMAPFMSYWAGPGVWESLPDQKRHHLAKLFGTVLRDFAELTSGDWTPACQTYRGPLTLLCGGRSPQAIDTISTQILANYPQAERRVFPAFDHMAPVTHAAEVSALFLHCLGEVNHTGQFSGAKIMAA